MKNIKTITYLFLLLFVSLAFTTAEERYLLNPKASKVSWESVDEEGKKHNGTIDFKSGNLMIDTKIIKGGFFYIAMQSITCLDIKDEGFNREFITELRDETNLNLGKYKEATFKVLKTKRLDVPAGQNNYNVIGELTMKGIKKQVEFPALVTYSKKNVTFKASFSLTKEDLQMDYGMNFTFDVSADL